MTQRFSMREANREEIVIRAQHSFQTLVNVSADFLAGIGENER